MRRLWQTNRRVLKIPLQDAVQYWTVDKQGKGKVCEQDIDNVWHVWTGLRLLSQHEPHIQYRAYTARVQYAVWHSTEQSPLTVQVFSSAATLWFKLRSSGHKGKSFSCCRNITVLHDLPLSLKYPSDICALPFLIHLKSAVLFILFWWWTHVVLVGINQTTNQLNIIHYWAIQPSHQLKLLFFYNWYLTLFFCSNNQ